MLVRRTKGKRDPSYPCYWKRVRRSPTMCCMPDLGTTVGACSSTMLRLSLPSTTEAPSPGSYERQWSERVSSFLASQAHIGCVTVWPRGSSGNVPLSTRSLIFWVTRSAIRAAAPGYTFDNPRNNDARVGH